MLQTYKAILRGNRLEWNDAAPQITSDDLPIAVHVTILDDAQTSFPQQLSGQRMAAILEPVMHFWGRAW